MKSRILFKTLSFSLLAIASFGAHAQAGSFDVAAGGGLADFFGSGSSNTAKGLFEASALYDFAAHVGVGFEYTYTPVTTSGQQFTGFAATGGSNIQHYGGVVRIPFATSAHVEPFGAAHGARGSHDVRGFRQLRYRNA